MFYRKHLEATGYLVWEVLLYICCFYWLMNKAASGQSISEVSEVRNPKRNAEWVRSYVAAHKRQMQWNLAGNSQPHGDT